MKRSIDPTHDFTDRLPAAVGVSSSRRSFLATGTATTLVAGLGVHSSVAAEQSASPSETLRIGLVGAGGRGGGAITDSLSINQNVQLIAIADFDPDKPAALRRGLMRKYESAVDVADDQLHTGLDGYKKIIDNPDVDVVLFATPPGFRPGHVTAAVDAGKHVFAEKPTCVDPHGFRQCLKAHDQAVSQKTAIVTGTQYRRQTNYIEAVNRIRAGEIGDVIGVTSRYCSNGIWYRPRRDGMSDTEYQIGNWMHFVWLSGDQIAEQSVHNIDLMNWIMDATPETAFGSGGRFTRPEDSELWDSMSIDYRYPGDRFVSFKNRQIPDAKNENGTLVYGSQGTANILGINSGAFLYNAAGEEIWSMKGDIGAAYQQEHKDLIDSIRSGNPIVELKTTAESSLTAIMGRMACYSGQEVTWKFVRDESTLRLFPDEVDLGASRESGFAMPGKYKLT